MKKKYGPDSEYQAEASTVAATGAWKAKASKAVLPKAKRADTSQNLPPATFGIPKNVRDQK